MGSDYTSHDLPARSVGTRRTSDTGSPNTRPLGRSSILRTTEPRRPPRVVRSLSLQEQGQPPKSCGSSFNLHAGKNTKEVVAISICRGPLSLHKRANRQALNLAASSFARLVRPLWAKSGLMRRSKEGRLFDQSIFGRRSLRLSRQSIIG